MLFVYSTHAREKCAGHQQLIGSPDNNKDNTFINGTLSRTVKRDKVNRES